MKTLGDLTNQEQLEELHRLYLLYSDGSSGLNKTVRHHPGFAGCLQWVFTPDIIDIQMLPMLDSISEQWGIVINVELIHRLKIKGIDVANIIFYADCEWRAQWAKKICGLPDRNVHMLPNGHNKKILRNYIKTMKKSVDFVLNNVPFGMFKDFKDLAQNLAKKKAIIISGSRDYHNGTAFENVEYYKFLGDCFPTAKITASLAIVDPNGVSKLKIIDDNNVEHIVMPNPEVTPGNDIDIWMFATSVINKTLPGYNNAEKGEIDRKGSIIVPSGIPVIFSAGRNGEDFVEKNRATNIQDLVKDTTKLCWATIDQSQLPLIGGIGKHKVVVTHAANEPGHLGNPKYAAPDWGCGVNCWYIECTSKDDAIDCIQYLNCPEVLKLVKGLKSSVTSNSKAVWNKIPHHTYAKSWIPNYGS